MESLLEEAGLTKGEVKVYLALLEIGETTTGPLIKKSKISPSKTYDILERLMQKGLASFVVKGGMKYFSAADPKRITDYIKEREEALAEKREQLLKIIPELRLRKTVKERMPTATVYEGWKGLKTALQHILDTLKKGDELLIFGAPGGTPLNIYRAFFQRFHEQRVGLGIPAKMIFNWRVKETFGKDRESMALTEVKYMPPSIITPATIEIYNDFVLIALLTEQPLAVRIENRAIASSFREHFGLMWNERVRVYYGLEGIKDIFRETLNHHETLFIGGKGYIAKHAPDFFWNEFVPQAKKTGHHWKNLAQPSELVAEIAKQPWVEVRYLPPEYSTPNVIFIYGNHVANVLWQKEPISYVVTDVSIAKSYRDYFNLLWQEENRTYKGLAGIKLLCEEVVNTGEDYFIIGANGTLYDRYPALLKEFDAERVKKGIRRHHLAIQRIKGHPINRLPNTEARYLPKEFDSPVVIWIFGDYVANLIWDDEVVYLTKNKKVADDYRKYFNFLWKNAKE